MPLGSHFGLILAPLGPILGNLGPLQFSVVRVFAIPQCTNQHDLKLLLICKLPDPSLGHPKFYVTSWNQFLSQHDIRVALVTPSNCRQDLQTSCLQTLFKRPTSRNRQKTLIFLKLFGVYEASTFGNLAPQDQAFQAHALLPDGLLDPPRRAKEGQR